MPYSSYSAALLFGEPALRGATRYSCESPAPCACGWGIGTDECRCEETRLYCATCGGDWNSFAYRERVAGRWELQTKDDECCPYCGSDEFADDAEESAA